MSRIGVDIDDVLTDWYGRAHYLCTEAGITNGITPRSWHPFREYGCTDQLWYDVLALGTLSGELYGGPPYDGAVEQVTRLADAGHTIHIVTARGFLAHGHEIRKQTIDWLNHWGIPHDTLTFSPDKTVLTTDWFIDDSIKNYQALDAAGCRGAYLLNRSHNEVSGHCTRRRVDSLAEFVDKVLADD